MDVSEALVDYLAGITHLAAGSQLSYTQHLTVFSDWCVTQKVSLEQVNNKSVQLFLVSLKTTHKPHKHGKTQLSSATIVDYVRSLKTFLNWCLADEEYSQYVKAQMVKAIKIPRQEQFVKQIFTNEEITALFEACKVPVKKYAFQLRDTAILALLLDTGIRASELRTLTIGNVVFASQPKDDSYITVMGKGRKQREIPLGNRARRALHRYLRECRRGASKADVVFLSRYNGMMSHEALKDIIERLQALSTLSEDVDVNPHKFRHTFSARFMMQGGDVYDLSRLLGHSSVSVTENYLKSLSSQQVRARKARLSVLDNL